MATFITPPLTINAIQIAVANEFKVPVHEMVGPCRRADLALPRHVAMWIARRLVKNIYGREKRVVSLQQIGNAFGGRDHSTVSHGIDAVNERLAINYNDLQQQVSKLMEMLGGVENFLMHTPKHRTQPEQHA